MTSTPFSVLKAKGATTFLWKIENLSYWRKQTHDDFWSPEFKCASIPGHVFRLGLHPRGKGRLERLLVELHLCDFHNSVLIDYELSFLNIDGWPVAIGHTRNQKIEKETPLLLKPRPTVKDVYRARAVSFLPEDTLNLRFSVCKSNNDDVVSEYILARTCIEVLQTCYLISNESHIFRNLDLNNEIIIPLCLTMCPKEDVYIECVLCLKGPSLEDSVFKFKIAQPDYESFFLKFKISLLNKEKKIVEHWEDMFIFYVATKTQVWEMKNHLARKDVLDINITTVSMMIVATTRQISHNIEKIVRTPAFFRFDLSSTDYPKRLTSDLDRFAMP